MGPLLFFLLFPSPRCDVFHSFDSLTPAHKFDSHLICQDKCMGNNRERTEEVCLLQAVLQTRSKSKEDPEELPRLKVQGKTQEGEPQEMAGGESGLFQGPVRRSLSVAREASRLTAPLEEKAPRDTRRDPAGKTVWMRILSHRREKAL